jgi:hypothetical protein
MRMRMTTMMIFRMRTNTTRWMRMRAIPPDDKQDDEPMAEAEIPVSDEVLHGDGDGDGKEASEEGGQTGMEETKHKKTN